MKEYIKPEMKVKSLIQQSNVAAEVDDGLYEEEYEMSTPSLWWPED